VRSIFIRIPAVYFFAYFLGLRGIWLFQPVSWLFGAIFSAVFTIILVRKTRESFLLERIRDS
jgi:Na+-driven multidrug efflux pump